MLIRVGLPESTGLLPRRAAEAGLSVLISAGRLWDGKGGRFRAPGLGIWDLADVSLDSAGFVAMKHWGGYPWSVAQYVEMATCAARGKPPPWSWWSSMDLCCEPEIAGDRRIVEDRVRGTARLLGECRAVAADTVLKPPMPILQGWRPEDYLLSVEMTDAVLGGDWPDLVGVGSVCRRQIDGPSGILAVIRAIDGVLPLHVRLHLFGVKSEAARLLEGNSRIESVDSMAWDFRARKAAHAAGLPSRISDRAEEMIRWSDRQERGQREPFQLRLL